VISLLLVGVLFAGNKDGILDTEIGDNQEHKDSDIDDIAEEE